MIRRPCLAGVVALTAASAVLIAEPTTAPATRPAAAAPVSLDGDWGLTSAMANGEAVPPELIGQMTITFAGNLMTNSITPAQAVTFERDDTQDPKWFDISERGQTGMGIYKLDGNVLTVCCSLPGHAVRPVTFEAPEESNRMLMILTRRVPIDVAAPATQPK